MRSVARNKRLRCRHCRTPLEHLDDEGRCVGCGTSYDFPEAMPDRAAGAALSAPTTRRLPGSIAAICLVAVVLALALLFVVVMP